MAAGLPVMCIGFLIGHRWRIYIGDRLSRSRTGFARRPAQRRDLMRRR